MPLLKGFTPSSFAFASLAARISGDSGTVMAVRPARYPSMSRILAEINSDRSAHWTDYDETDWAEGLDEWTLYEPVGV